MRRWEPGSPAPKDATPEELSMHLTLWGSVLVEYPMEEAIKAQARERDTIARWILEGSKEYETDVAFHARVSVARQLIDLYGEAWPPEGLAIVIIKALDELAL